MAVEVSKENHEEVTLGTMINEKGITTGTVITINADNILDIITTEESIENVIYQLERAKFIALNAQSDQITQKLMTQYGEAKENNEG